MEFRRSAEPGSEVNNNQNHESVAFDDLYNEVIAKCMDMEITVPKYTYN